MFEIVHLTVITLLTHVRSLHREKGDWRPTRATQEMEEDHTHTLAQPASEPRLYFTENAQKYTPARTSAQAAGSSGARVDDGGLMGG
eukprot:scaffold27336_cov63-Phaeocystis_antarctica.AAC.3